MHDVKRPVYRAALGVVGGLIEVPVHDIAFKHMDVRRLQGKPVLRQSLHGSRLAYSGVAYSGGEPIYRISMARLSCSPGGLLDVDQAGSLRESPVHARLVYLFGHSPKPVWI